jgi:hypothetical protein
MLMVRKEKATMVRVLNNPKRAWYWWWQLQGRGVPTGS